VKGLRYEKLRNIGWIFVQLRSVLARFTFQKTWLS